MNAPWSITLGWRDILNLALGALAIYQFFRNRRTETTCNDVIKRQATQSAAHGFAEMARTAYDLETWIGKNEWDRSLELAKRMMVSLAEISGTWSVILETSDTDIFGAARTEIASVEKSISLAMQNAPTPQQSEEMRQQCINAAAYLAQTAGRLKRPDEIKAPMKGVVRTLIERLRGTKEYEPENR
jgi:hypothetical protein